VTFAGSFQGRHIFRRGTMHFALAEHTTLTKNNTAQSFRNDLSQWPIRQRSVMSNK